MMIPRLRERTKGGKNEIITRKNSFNESTTLTLAARIRHGSSDQDDESPCNPSYSVVLKSDYSSVI